MIYNCSFRTLLELSVQGLHEGVNLDDTVLVDCGYILSQHLSKHCVDSPWWKVKALLVLEHVV